MNCYLSRGTGINLLIKEEKLFDVFMVGFLMVKPLLCYARLLLGEYSRQVGLLLCEERLKLPTL